MVRKFRHVGDLQQVTTAITTNTCKTYAAKEAVCIAEGVAAAGLDISPKSTVISSKPTAARAVAADLVRAGITVTWKVSSEDLGIAYSAGVRRNQKALPPRAQKADRGVSRARAVATVGAKAKRRWSTGIGKRAHFGREVQGATPSAIHADRQRAAASLLSPGKFSCVATLLAWHFNVDMDPFISAPMKQLQLWFQLLYGATARQRLTMATAWRRAAAEVAVPKLNWRKVTCPCSATIAVVSAAGWIPESAVKWFTPEKDHVANRLATKPGARNGVKTCFRATLLELLWKEAAKHNLGNGLGTGPPSFKPAKSVAAWLARHGHPPPTAGPPSRCDGCPLP